MPTNPVKSLTIEGFRSIAQLPKMSLPDRTILVGANGAGKSNFIGFFQLLRAIAKQDLGVFVQERGGGDGMLFGGPKVTKSMKGVVHFGLNGYEFELIPTPGNTLVFKREVLHFNGPYFGKSTYDIGVSGEPESRLKTCFERGPHKNVAEYVFPAINSWVVYHFHDTGIRAGMRRECNVADDADLFEDAANLAAFLHRLRDAHPTEYRLIRDTVRLVAPFFDDFKLKPRKRGDEQKLRLDWTQKSSDMVFQPWHLSDGTLRFIGLATTLLQPNPPTTILIDEPELGLHPYAIQILGGLVRSASTRTQVVITTQSPLLVSQFEAEDILVADRREGGSLFTRLDTDGLSKWLTEYSLGELWQKNYFNGGPSHEPTSGAG